MNFPICRHIFRYILPYPIIDDDVGDDNVDNDVDNVVGGLTGGGFRVLVCAGTGSEDLPWRAPVFVFKSYGHITI
jgi:hypothetical protein